MTNIKKISTTVKQNEAEYNSNPAIVISPPEIFQRHTPINARVSLLSDVISLDNFT